MKHFLKLAAAAAPFLLPAAGLAVLAPTSAAAQAATYGTSLTINAEADVAARCDARLNSASGTVLAIDFGTLSDTAPAAQVTAGAGSATYICNDRDGFTRTIASANGGWLTLGGTATADPNRRIRYTMQHGGGAGLGFAETQLTTPIVNTYNGGVVPQGTTGSVTFRANGVGTNIGTPTQSTTVFAGDYSDVVTIAIAAR